MTAQARLVEASRLIAHQYQADGVPWFLGFSGGKDSCLLLAAVYNALLELESAHKAVTVLYCDTGVEIPPVSQYAHRQLERLSTYAQMDGIPLSVKVVSPRMDDTFFVKVAGAGYVPPTNKFRWCTDRLRVGPVRRAMRAVDSRECFMLLGTRWAESETRTRTLNRFSLGGDFFFKQAGNRLATIFAPISQFTTPDVWRAIHSSSMPDCLDVDALSRLYRAARGASCSGACIDCEQCTGGRFGCWTCTVVRRDRAVQNMISHGFPELAPLLEFRNWLSRIRDDREYRWATRRNGKPGLGPFTMDARVEILARLRSAERESGMSLLKDAEWQRIEEAWQGESEQCQGVLQPPSNPGVHADAAPPALHSVPRAHRRRSAADAETR